MNRVKVIKRHDINQPPATRKYMESELRRQANEIRRKTANTVTDWISEWREQKEKLTADALAELRRLSPAVRAT